MSAFKVYLRYSGQGWEIPITLTEDQAKYPDEDVFRGRFIEEYSKLFARPVAGMEIEMTVWSVNATTPPVPVIREIEQNGSALAKVTGKRQIFDPALGEFVTASIVSRNDMGEGAIAIGPGAIIEDETTIIVPSSRRAVRQKDGCIDMSLQGKQNG